MCAIVLCYKGACDTKISSVDVSKLKAWYIEHLKSDTVWEQEVRLVLVKDKKIQRSDDDLGEATKLTLQGQIDELLLRKELLDQLKDVFHYQNKPCPHIVLIIGGPGEC